MDSVRIHEVSVNSPIGVPICQLKLVIPAAGFLLAVQGIAEILRCIICIRTGEWPERLHDVEEMETAALLAAAKAEEVNYQAVISGEHK